IIVNFEKMPIDKYNYDNIFKIIDPLLKSSWLILCKSNIIGKEVCRLYYKGPFRIF
ncbi:hypothetical protein QR685DRAFT_400504, partial [Neurospora intermedia]